MSATNAELNAALAVALGFRRPNGAEAISVGDAATGTTRLWSLVQNGKMRSVHADHWAAAGFQFYVWEHVTNEHEALRAEVMVLNAVFPPAVRFSATAEGVVVHTPDDPGTKLPLPGALQINERLAKDLQYLRQIRGLEPLPPNLFLERMRLEVEEAPPDPPEPPVTAAELAQSEALMAGLEHEVDS
jgi:hypothetical protein